MDIGCFLEKQDNINKVLNSEVCTSHKVVKLKQHGVSKKTSFNSCGSLFHLVNNFLISNKSCVILTLSDDKDKTTADGGHSVLCNEGQDKTGATKSKEDFCLSSMLH